MNSKPNILFFLPDQHRPDWLGTNPLLPLRTPHLNRLAEQGIRFRRAYTPSPLCAPARACLAAGLSYETCRVPSNHANFPLVLPTHYRHLQDAGYHVCGVGKFDLHKETLNWNLDGSRLLSDWGFTEGIDSEGKLDGSSSYRKAGCPRGPYLAFLHSHSLAELYVREHEQRHAWRDAYITALPEEAYGDNWVAENGLHFLQNFPRGQPWYLVVNFPGPHNPMDVTPRMANAWQTVPFPPPFENSQPTYSADDHQRNRRHYAAMIENIDRHVGRFLALVRQRGEEKNTLIVYASDHGEMLGDHNHWGKHTWYEPSVGIPLIIAGPSITPNRVSDALVCLQDLAATFLDYADAQPLPNADALSLRPLLEGRQTNHRPFALSGLLSWRMVTDGRFKLVVEKGYPDRLFDLLNDPWEHRNLAAERPGEVARLKANLPVVPEHKV